MVLSEAEVLYGGAYRVCFEQLNPDNCASRDDLVIVNAQFTKIVTWAETQTELVKTAYMRALADVLKRATDRLENTERALALTQAYNVIPKPPSD